MKCPLCSNTRVEVLLRREKIPVLQNVVYASRELARAAAAAPFALGQCQDCGFAFNSEFDEQLVHYGVDYDNDVPSPTFLRYYREVADLLIRRAGLRDCTVYEVGCGKGTFLEVLCEAEPTLRAVGIDPSCTPRSEPRLELRRAMFAPSEFEPGARLVLLRHVLEHIGNPVGFLRELRKAVPAGASLYVEVPDLRWIIGASAFWDFCYEHCNYFTPDSLRLALSLAGFQVAEQDNSFGGQYQWALCSPGQPTDSVLRPPDRAAAEYARREQQEFTRFRTLAQQSPCVSWGMATKGVMLNVLVPGLVGGVDVNAKKQGKFAAVSGIEIHSPDWLKNLPGEKTVLIMNPTYEQEIRAQLRTLGVQANVVPV